jgi:glutamate N-acetyltransferase / amino-acid N-acetyltransferase
MAVMDVFVSTRWPNENDSILKCAGPARRYGQRMSIPVPAVPTFPVCAFPLTSVSGLQAAGVKAGLKASGNHDVGLLVSDDPMACAAIFTQNHFAAAPVFLSRTHLARSSGFIRAVVVNSGNANACTGAQGETDALAMCRQVASLVGCRTHEVLVCSTGVIGVKLPMSQVRRGIDEAFRALSSREESGRNFLKSIMTTDAFPKECGLRAGDVTMAGICKGAGMIQPNMATMLAFLATDGHVSPSELQESIVPIAATSFNAVHVDSHTSTNDTFLMLSTAKKPIFPQWKTQLASLAHRLAWLIARDGEGATKVTTIRVSGAKSDEAARSIAAQVASSALVRTALFGNDPNWGRFTSQVGNSTQVVNANSLVCRLQGRDLFRAGEPVPFERAALSQAMREEDVLLELLLDDGVGEAMLMTSDLGYRYVQVNAEYTT